MNRPLPLIQKILIVGLILAFLAFFADLLFDRTKHYTFYLLSVWLLFGGLQTIAVGVAQVREVRRQGQNAIWHQQPGLLVGIVVLFSAFYSFIFTLANTTLPSAKVDAVSTAIIIISIIPFYLLIRAAFYWLKRGREREGEQ